MRFDFSIEACKWMLNFENVHYSAQKSFREYIYRCGRVTLIYSYRIFRFYLWARKFTIWRNLWRINYAMTSTGSSLMVICITVHSDTNDVTKSLWTSHSLHVEDSITAFGSCVRHLRYKPVFTNNTNLEHRPGNTNFVTVVIIDMVIL